jgi:hypothetical protein
MLLLIPRPRGAVLTPLPRTFLTVVVQTGWESRRMDGRQWTTVSWLRICRVLRVGSGRIVTTFGWDRQTGCLGLIGPGLTRQKEPGCTRTHHDHADVPNGERFYYVTHVYLYLHLQEFTLLM